MIHNMRTYKTSLLLKIFFNDKIKIISKTPILTLKNNKNHEKHEINIIENTKRCVFSIVDGHLSHIHKILRIHCSFLNISFWSSKFYFGRFDPNWRPINFNFLGNGGIARREKNEKKYQTWVACRRFHEKYT